MTGAEGAERAVAVIVILVWIAPHWEDGGAGQEVGAGPGHSSFLFLARSADLEFTRSDDSMFERWLRELVWMLFITRVRCVVFRVRSEILPRFINTFTTQNTPMLYVCRGLQPWRVLNAHLEVSIALVPSTGVVFLKFASSTQTTALIANVTLYTNLGCHMTLTSQPLNFLLNYTIQTLL